MRTVWLLSLFIAIPFALSAQEKIEAPKRGTELRKAMLDVFRGPVKKDLGQKVIFKISRLRVSKKWAFLNAQPLTPDGNPINYAKTKYAEAVRDGFFDDGLYALAKKGKNGEWKVVALVIGATDVSYEPWPDEFGAPRGLFFDSN